MRYASKIAVSPRLNETRGKTYGPYNPVLHKNKNCSGLKKIIGEIVEVDETAFKSFTECSFCVGTNHKGRTLKNTGKPDVVTKAQPVKQQKMEIRNSETPLSIKWAAALLLIKRTIPLPSGDMYYHGEDVALVFECMEQNSYKKVAKLKDELEKKHAGYTTEIKTLKRCESRSGTEWVELTVATVPGLKAANKIRIEVLDEP